MPRAPSKDPFAGIASSPPSAAIAVSRAPTPDPFAGRADPFAAASSPAVADPFSAPAGGMIAPADPFGLTGSSGDGELSVDDADVADAEDVGAHALSQPQSSAPFDGGGDPFGALDAEEPGPVDAGNLFAAPAPAPVPPRIPEQSRVAPPLATAPLPIAPPTGPGADMAKLRRLELTQRAKEIAWAAAQGALFLVFLVVAVVLGRGGDLRLLLSGDVRAAFAGAGASSDLGIEHARVSRRVLDNGSAVVVITGTVHNRTDKSVPAARVAVRFGDAADGVPTDAVPTDAVPTGAAPTGAPAQAEGWAWSTVDGIDVDGLHDAAAAAALSLRVPASASLAPGDRAPFVVLAPAPADGSSVRISAAAVAAIPAP